MGRIGRAWPALLGGVAYVCALPPLNLAPLVFLALAPWLWSLRFASTRDALKSGYLFGAVIVAVQMSWTQQLVVKWTGSALLSFLPWVVCIFIGGWYFAILAWAWKQCCALDKRWVFPILWSGMEVIRSFIPGLAFPFFLIATPLAQYPWLIQPAFFGTIYFVGAWVVFVNIMVVRATERFSWSSVRPYALVSLVFVLVSLVRLSWPTPGKIRPITVAQTGVDLAFGDARRREADLSFNIDRIYSISALYDSELLLLPEGLSAQATSQLPPIVPFEIRKYPPILFGGRRGVGPVYQSAFAFDGSWSFSDKTRLVVFGEYVPGRDVIPLLKYFNLPGGDITPGDRVATIKVAGMTVGPLICFEGLFWDVAHNQASAGAQILAVMAIDDWYLGTLAPEQLAMSTTWRAVETGLPVMRSASLGITMAVDSRGREMGRAPVGSPFVLPVGVTVPDEAPSWPLRPLWPYGSAMAWLVFLPYVWRRRAL